MAFRIEVASKVADTRADVRKRMFLGSGFRLLKSLQIADVYTLDKSLTKDQITKISEMLSNPVTQTTKFKPSKFTWAIEIGFLPGVMDNVANTARETIEDLLKMKFEDDEGVYSSQITFVTVSTPGVFSKVKQELHTGGDISKHLGGGHEEVNKLADSLFNPLIQRANIKSFKQFKKDKGMDVVIPRVSLEKTPTVSLVDLNISDEELTKIGKQGVENEDGTRRGPLALSLPYMKAIQLHFKKLGRNPTDIEMETIAQTWSEHCKHTIFADPIDEEKNGLFKAFIRAATEKIRKKKGQSDFCVSVFSDNSGAIEFDNNFLITHKVETHNSPSALDPFGGSITGIVGVNRDTIGFGLGAKPIINTYGFCFADPNDKVPLYRDSMMIQKMLLPRRIMDGVIAGVNSGGNQSGIPTPQGFIYLDSRYKGKPLVFCGTVGLIPKKVAGRLAHIKKARPNDYIVMIGGRVGKDGIHGATFSSEGLDTGSPAGAVQIGDPITQKKLSDALVKEARDLGLYNSITDDGAGGLSSSVSEMAKESGGCLVNLEKVPLKYAGLEPWEIWISESQERMTLAVPKNKWPKFSDLMRRRGVEATVIGEFTKNGQCLIKYGGETVLNLSLEFLHFGLPKRILKTKPLRQVHQEPNLPKSSDLTKTFLSILSRPNISSFEFISGQYDHEVQGSSVLKPLQGRGRVNAETSVVRPILSSVKGIVLSQGMYPTYSDIDTYSMAASSIDTAIRNIVAAGGNPDYIALLDNFCWYSPNEETSLWQLKRADKACFDTAVEFGSPFISGKDSMYNDFTGFDEKGRPIKISVPPTLLISSIGVVEDVTKTISLDAKFSGDLVYILGETSGELGGSEYFALFNAVGNKVPQVNAKKNKKLYLDYYKCVQSELIASAVGITRGGLGVALAKMSMGGLLGLEINLKNLPGRVSRDDFALFSESQGRILVTVAPENSKQFEKLMRGNALSLIGTVTGSQEYVVKGLKKKEVVKTSINSMLNAYKSTFKDF